MSDEETVVTFAKNDDGSTTFNADGEKLVFYPTSNLLLQERQIDSNSHFQQVLEAIEKINVRLIKLEQPQDV